MRSVVRLGHSLSDAHAFGPLSLEPVSGYMRYVLQTLVVPSCVIPHDKMWFFLGFLPSQKRPKLPKLPQIA